MLILVIKRLEDEFQYELTSVEELIEIQKTLEIDL